MKIHAFLSLALVGLLLSTFAHSVEHHSPRTAGLGGAGHAAPLLNDATYLNPSYIAFLKTYSVAANYLSYDGQSEGGSTGIYGRNYNLSLQDGRNQSFQAGAGYTVRDGSKVLTVGLGKAFSPTKPFSVGIGFSRIFDLPGKRNVNLFSISSTVAASRFIQFSFNVDNMLENESTRQEGRFREFILGSKINIKNRFFIYADPHYTPSLAGAGKWGYQIGGELLTVSDIYIRYGLFENAFTPFILAYSKGYSYGAGWVAPKISFDYAFSKVSSRLDGGAPASSHTFSATVFF